MFVLIHPNVQEAPLVFYGGSSRLAASEQQTMERFPRGCNTTQGDGSHVAVLSAFLDYSAGLLRSMAHKEGK